jgi:protein-L-isoaspartate O-methyltransferase
MMARFLQMLDVCDGDTVLEIGTGTGYNAGLLSERLGAANVTSIDIDPGCVASARAALLEISYRPAVVVADGTYGYPARAPYDRIIATCAVAQVPEAWIDQLRPGGAIVAPLTGRASGGLVALRARPDGTLQGRLHKDGAGFMSLRPEADSYQQDSQWSELFQIVHHPDEGANRRDCTVPKDMGHPFMFFLSLRMPDLVWFPTLHGVSSRVDRSWARVYDSDDNSSPIVLQGGPRRLWDGVETMNGLWLALGEPRMDRYGMTITPDRRQFLWLDSPDSEHRWEL